MLTHDELPIIHFLLNTDCNAWDRPNSEGSPGVCRFCYRERNRVETDRDTVEAVLNALRKQSAANRIVFTGGDPVMPYNNHLEFALGQAKALGFETNLHTNGLLLAERYQGLRDMVDLYSLAIDGPDAVTADWFRGEGYFDRFQENVLRLVRGRRRLAFNTFTAAPSIDRLPQLAEQIRDISKRDEVEYWLISQYRPIGRASARKNELYGFSPARFAEAVEQARGIVAPLTVFDQPTRRTDDPYSLRVWVLANGTVTADLGSVTASRNAVLGNLLQAGFEPLVRRAHRLRDAQAASNAAASRQGPSSTGAFA